MKKIPCKNCICFPVCKSQAVGKTLADKMYVRLIVLHKKCKLFEKWYNRSYNSGYPTAEVEECFNTSYTTWDRWGW
jgi:hypothetical protein